MEYTAIIKKMSNGWYFAQCEQLPGAMTQGETIEEAKENLKDAIHLLLEDEKADSQNNYPKTAFTQTKLAVI